MHDPVDATVKELFGSSAELLDEATMERLSNIVRESLAAQESLASKLKKRQIGPMVFEGSAMAEQKLVLSKIKEIIGDQLFYDIFGEAGDHPESIINPELFKEALGHYAD